MSAQAALEAILMVSEEPVSPVTLAQVVDLPVDQVVALLEAMSAEYTSAERGFDLREVAGGWRFYTRPEQHAVVEKFVTEGATASLTQAALETWRSLPTASPSPVAGSRQSEESMSMPSCAPWSHVDSWRRLGLSMRLRPSSTGPRATS